MDKEAKRTSLVGKAQPIGRGHCIVSLVSFFSKTLPASRSITHKRVDAENIGFLHHSIDLDTRIEQEDLSNNPFVHLNMPCMYILYRVCSRYCDRLNRG